MTAPALELRVSTGDGVQQVQALKEALALLNGEVSALSQAKNYSALDQLVTEVKGLRTDLKAATDEIRKTLSDGLKGAFQEAQKDAVQGSKDLNNALQKAATDAGKAGEQIGDSLAQGLEKSSVRARVAAQGIDLSNGLRISVSGDAAAADKVKRLADQYAQTDSARAAIASKEAASQLSYRIKLIAGNAAIVQAREAAADSEAAAALGYRIKMMTGSAAIVQAQEAAADKEATSALGYRIKMMTGSAAIVQAQEAAADKEATSALGYRIKMMTGSAAIVQAQETEAERQAASALGYRIKMMTGSAAITEGQALAAAREEAARLAWLAKMQTGSLATAEALALAAAREESARLAWLAKMQTGSLAITEGQALAAAREESARLAWIAKMQTGSLAIAREIEADALAYAAAVAKADAVYKLASEKSQLSTTFKASSLLESGAAVETVTRQFGSLAVAAAQGAGSSEVLFSSLANLPRGAKAAEEGIGALASGVRFGSGAFREAGTELGELLGGNFSRLRQTSFALANQMGLLKLAFTGVGAVVSITAAVIGIFATAITQGEKEVSAFKNTMQVTGGYAGITRGQFEDMAHSLATETVSSIGTAKAALMDMAKTGKFTGDTMAVLGQSIVLQAHISGESLDAVAKDYAKMPDGVHKWAVEHNESMHFMSAAQLEHIRLLELQGEKQKALIEVGELLNAHLARQTENLGYLEKGWLGIKNAASLAWDAMLGVGREATTEDKIQKLRDKITALQKLSTTNGTLGKYQNGQGLDTSSDIASLQEQLKFMERVKTSQEDIARAKSDAARIQAEGAAGDKVLEQLGVRISKVGKEKEAIEQATTAIKEHNKAWLDAGHTTDQPYSTLTGQGFIGASQQATMMQLVHEKFNGGGGRSDGGVSSLLKEQWKNEEAALKEHFAAEKAEYDNQYRNKEVDEGTYIATSEARTAKYRADLLDGYVKSLQDMTAKEQAAIAALPLNMGADARTKRIQALQNQLQQSADNGWATVQKDILAVDTSFNKLGDNAVGAMIKATGKNQAYWDKAEQGVKKTADLAQARRDLAGATEEERARAEAVIKVEDSHAAYMDSLQEKYNLSVVAVQNYVTETEKSGPWDEQKIKNYLALARAAQGYSDAVEYARTEVAKLSQQAGDAAVVAVADKKIQELRNSATQLAKTTSSSIVDALLTGGKAGVTKLRDAVKQAFLSPIKIILQAVMQPIANGLVNLGYSALGLGNATSTGSGLSLLNTGSSLLNIGSSLSNTASVGYQFLTGGMSGANAAGTVAANATGTGLDGLLATNGAYGTAAGGAVASLAAPTAEELAFSGVSSGVAAGGAAAGGTGLLASASDALIAMGPVGWAALAAVAAYAIFGGKGGGPKDESSFGYSIANPADKTPDAAKAIADAINTGYQTLATQLGLSNTALNAGVLYSKDPKGTAQTQLDVTAGSFSRGELYGTTENVGRSDAEFQEAIAQATEQAIISGLLNSDLDQRFKDYLSGVDLKSTSAVLAQKVTDVLNAKKITDVFMQLGSGFDYLKTTSVEAINSLINATGGLDALSTKLNNFYGNFYTDIQKHDILQASLTEQFAKLNLTLPKTRDDFKNLVLSQNLATQSGQDTFNALLNLSDAFSQLTANAIDLTDATHTQAVLDNKVADARATLQTAYSSEADRLVQVRDHMQSFADSLTKFLVELTTGDLSGLTPQQTYAGAKAQFEQDAQGLNSSDPLVRDAALTDIQDAGKAFLDASRTMNAASDGYYADLAEVTSAVQQAKAISLASVSVAQLQLTTLDNMASGLVELRAADTSGLAALYDVSHTGFNAVVAALQALSSTTTAAVAGPAPTADTATAAITSYYSQYLGRAPETTGLNYWLSVFNSGIALSDIQQSIKTSPESIQHNGGVPLRAGLDSVPYDNFPAMLHKNETVLNAAEADKRRRQLADQDETIRKLEARLASLESTLGQKLDTVVVAQFASTDQAANKVSAAHKQAAQDKGWNSKVRGAVLK